MSLERPPLAIRTPRLVLRCWEPSDAPLLDEAIGSSVGELREWMPWAWEEPLAMTERAALLQSFHDGFHEGRDYVFGIFAADESEVIGGTGLHTRAGEGAFEIGYWIRTSRTGQGYATEATAALAAIALTVCGADRVEIRVDPANAASRRIPEKLGFAREALLRRRLPPVSGLGPPRDVVLFTLFADELSRSPVAGAVYEALA